MKLSWRQVKGLCLEATVAFPCRHNNGKAGLTPRGHCKETRLEVNISVLISRWITQI